MPYVKLNEKGEWETLPSFDETGKLIKYNDPGVLTIDSYLRKNLDNTRSTIRRDWDYMFVCDGMPGCGKSVFIQQAAWYVSNGNLTLTQVCFTADEFKKAILSAPKYSAVIFDESFRGLSSRAALSIINKTLIELFNEIRQRNLYVFIIIPSIWDLDKHVVLFRCQGLFHVYTGKRKERGFFKYYKNSPYFKKFITAPANRYSYPKLCSFRGRFSNKYVLDELAYKEKKAKALGSSPAPEEGGNRKKDFLFPIYQKLMSDDPTFKKISKGKVAELLGIDTKTEYRWRSDIRKAASEMSKDEGQGDPYDFSE